MFSGCTVPPDSKETKLGSSDQRLLHQQVKIQGVLVPCHAWKCVPIAFSGGVNISMVPDLSVISYDK